MSYLSYSKSDRFSSSCPEALLGSPGASFQGGSCLHPGSKYRLLYRQVRKEKVTYVSVAGTAYFEFWVCPRTPGPLYSQQADLAHRACQHCHTPANNNTQIQQGSSFYCFRFCVLMYIFNCLKLSNSYFICFRFCINSLRTIVSID